MSYKSVALGIVVAIVCLLGCSKKVRKLHLAQESISKDYYHGQEVVDPYRHLENLQDSTTLNWFIKQNEITENTLDRIPSRTTFFNKLRTHNENDSPVISFLRITENDRHFYLKKTSSNKTAILYYKDGILGDEVELYNLLIS